MNTGLLGLIVAISVLLSGCVLDNTRLYDGSTPDLPQRWPDDAATCPVYTEIIRQLGIVVTWTKFPLFPNGIAGCGFDHPVVDIDGSVGAGYNGIDSTGFGVKSYNVYYKIIMDDNRHLCLERKVYSSSIKCKPALYNIDPEWTYHAPNIPAWGPNPKGPDWTSKTWTFNRPIFDRTETINGLKWHHYMFWQYESLSSDANAPALPVDSPEGQADDPSALTPAPVVSVRQPDALEMVGEVYRHAVDADHTMLIFANYMRPVTQDAHWFAARRAMLRKLVDAVTIRPLTPDLWHTLLIQYRTQTKVEGESRDQAESRAEAERIFQARHHGESTTSP